MLKFWFTDFRRYFSSRRKCVVVVVVIVIIIIIIISSCPKGGIAIHKRRHLPVRVILSN